MIVLPDQRENCRSQITLERKTGNYALMDGLVSGQKDTDSYLQPGRFRALSWMIKSREFRSLKGVLKPRVGYEFNQPDALQPASVFSREAVKRILDLTYSILR
jgi:hypothetical protein